MATRGTSGPFDDRSLVSQPYFY
jgi:3-methylcrotonyl-CoA carboxylase alpha subunit